MTARRIFCEGPDDRSALRELISRGFTRKIAALPGNTTIKGVRLTRAGAEDVELADAGSRDKVLMRARDVALESGSPSSPVRLVGLSFDPDSDDESTWRAWIERAFMSWNPQPQSGGWLLEGPFGPVELIPLPWSITSTAHASLPDKQSIERVTAQIVASVHPDLAVLVDRWLSEASSAGRVPSWKMSARFWNGLLAEDVSGPSFFDKVFGQEPTLRSALDQVLRGTLLWRGLQRLDA